MSAAAVTTIVLAALAVAVIAGFLTALALVLRRTAQGMQRLVGAAGGVGAGDDVADAALDAVAVRLDRLAGSLQQALRRTGVRPAEQDTESSWLDPDGDPS